MEVDKILQRIRNEKDNVFPQTVLIDTVTACNLKCSMCPHKNMKRKHGIMGWELYKKIINEIAEKSPDSRIWITFFGEGLILKDLDEKIKYAKDTGCNDVVLNSNGVALNFELSKRIIQSGLDALYVGVDAFKAETYKGVRVGGELDKTIEGILSYKRALDEFGNAGQKLFVQFVVMDNNKDELDDFLEFWNEKGINVKVRPMISWAGTVEASNLDAEIDRLPCYWLMNTMCITSTGKVAYCVSDMDCDVELGDISVSTIEDLWNHEVKKIRNMQLDKEWNQLPPICRDCLDWQSGYANYHLAE